MPVSAAERDFLLAQVDRLAQTDLNNLWRQADELADVDFFTYMSAGFPEIADVYHQTAGQLAATWFEQSNPASRFVAQVAEPIVREQLANSVEWALGGDGEQGLARMSGTLQRAVYEGARDTVVLNAEASGSRWLRVARPNACEFCRMLATRTGQYAYRSEGVVKNDKGEFELRVIGQKARNRRKGARKLGEKYHDFCHCQAVEIRDTQTVDEVLNEEQRKLFQQWNEEYDKAVANAGGASDTKRVLSAWREQTSSIAPSQQVNTLKQISDATSINDVGDYLRAKHNLKVDNLLNAPLNNGITLEIPSIMGGPSQKIPVEGRFIELRTAQEFGQAVDDMLVKYPYLKLDSVDADWWPTRDHDITGAPAFAWPKVDQDGKTIGAQRVTISAGFGDPKGQEGSAWESRERWMQSDEYDAAYKKSAAGKPIYKTGVHEMGHVMDYTGGLEARKSGALALRNYILQTPEVSKLQDKFLANTTPEAFQRVYGGRFDLTTAYAQFEKKWLRKNIVSSYSFKDSDRKKAILNMPEALAEAFTDVELRGEDATVASKVLHQAMVEAATKATRP